MFFMIFIWQETVVLRGGRRYTTPVDRLVVGDIVDVKFGDRVPADIRIIMCSGFKVVYLIALCNKPVIFFIGGIFN